jgi:hypothetical protein
LVAAIPKSIPVEKRPEKAMGGAGVKKEGKGTPLFHSGRTPGRSIRSLFGFSIVKFGIAAKKPRGLSILLKDYTGSRPASALPEVFTHLCPISGDKR